VRPSKRRGEKSNLEPGACGLESFVSEGWVIVVVLYVALGVVIGGIILLNLHAIIELGVGLIYVAAIIGVIVVLYLIIVENGWLESVQLLFVAASLLAMLGGIIYSLTLGLGGFVIGLFSRNVSRDGNVEKTLNRYGIIASGIGCAVAAVAVYFFIVEVSKTPSTAELNQESEVVQGASTIITREDVKSKSDVVIKLQDEDILTVEELQKMGIEFEKAYFGAGVTGAVILVQECYESIDDNKETSNVKRLTYCLSLDTLGFQFETAGSKMFPVHPYWEESEWRSRLHARDSDDRYSPIVSDYVSLVKLGMTKRAARASGEEDVSQPDSTTVDQLEASR
jgi:hypothetical protein